MDVDDLLAAWRIAGPTPAASSRRSSTVMARRSPPRACAGSPKSMPSKRTSAAHPRASACRPGRPDPPPGRRLRRLAAAAASARLGQVPPRREARLHPPPLGRPANLPPDGRVEIDSNCVENLVSPIALNRKNALFAGHDEGGKAWGRIASLIETCKINGVEPFAYLKSTLEAIAAGHPQNRIDDLLPWNFQPSS
jgi:hypothetical protein